MAYALSPGVTTYEKDFTSIVPAVSSSNGAFVGKFPWGPVLYPVQLSSENDLVAQFGKPNSSNFESFFTAANFLSYSSSIWLIRQDSVTGVNAVGNAGTAVKIKNTDHYNTLSLSGFDWAAKYPGVAGNSLKVSYADSATFYDVTGTGTIAITYAGQIGTVTGTGTAFSTQVNIGDILKSSDGATIYGVVTAVASATSLTVLSSSASPTNVGAGAAFKYDWGYYTQFDSAPGTSTYATNQNATNDELHVIVIDEDGIFSGVAGTVLEKYAFVSKASDARKNDGTVNYFKDVINSQSKYIWWGRNTTAVTGTTAWGTAAAGSTFKSLTGTQTTSLAGGVDDYTDSGSYVQAGWALFLDDLQYDINLLMLGKATSVTANYVIQNICEVRKDCIAFVSPQDNSTGNLISGTGSSATTALITYRNAITSSSYGFMDTGYKYQYDRYNDVYRWVPLNGDIAGLSARTDNTNDPWWSPAGLNRGQIKNIVKLAVNPSKTDRDTLYTNSINPVVAFTGQGIVLYGDKTLLSKPSAFDRINVRRLFIVLEKAISTAAKYQLFEFNDAFTRAQFKSIVEPFLRDVKGRRGVTDFRVVCDETNNTGEVIDRNEFVGSIFIKPSRSINFITLNFVAVRTGVSFSEVGG